MMNLGLLSSTGSASDLGQVEKDDDPVLNAPSLVPYFSQVWLTYLMLGVFNRAISSLMGEWVCKLSMVLLGPSKPDYFMQLADCIGT